MNKNPILVISSPSIKMMRIKKIIVFVSLVLTLPIMAGNPIQNPFGNDCLGWPSNGLFYYPNWDKQFNKFQEHCIENLNPSHKQAAKLKLEYEELCKLKPEFKYAAMCHLGYNYLYSEGSQENKIKAVEMIMEGLAHSNDIKVTDSIRLKWQQKFLGAFSHHLGYAYLTGTGVEQDFGLAYLYFRKEMDYAGASTALAFCALLGIGTDVDFEYAKEQATEYRCQANIHFESLMFAHKWDSYHHTDSTTISLFRNGIIRWLAVGDFEGAQISFEEAINNGHMPSMCELAMLYLDNRWEKNNEKQFELLAKQATERGYPPASYLIGRCLIDRWGKDGVPFSSANIGKAYPFFLASGKLGYLPAIEVIKKYETGELSKKTGLAAAFGDLNEGFKGGDPNSPGVVEGLLLISDELNNRLNNASSATESADISTTGTNTAIAPQQSSIGQNGINASATSNSTVNNKKTNRSVITKHSGLSIPEPIYKTCKKCGGSGKVSCYMCKGKTRHTCGACHGKGYNTRFKDRKCTLCNGKGDILCGACIGRGTKKCMICNGKGQVSR